MKIEIPRSIKSDHQGYWDLIYIFHQIRESHAKIITLDFTKNTWFEANLFAVMGAILFSEGKGFDDYVFQKLNSALLSVLERNGFLKNQHKLAFPSRNSTIIPYARFLPADGKDFATYIKNELLSKSDFPLLSKLAEKKIIESIFELFENAKTHGSCSHIYTCGQYFPNKNPPRMDITIVDLGKTIKKNVNDFLQENLNGHKAIEWAVKYGNTTKTGNNPGGLGLNVIFDFIGKNNGKIQIVSSDGYWEYNRRETKTQLFHKPFLGTIANIEFNLNDNNVYVAEEELDSEIIF